MLVLWKKSYDKPRKCIKKLRYHFADKGLYSQSYGFSSNHVWMCKLDHKESWVLKNWWFQIMVVQKSLESPLTSRESNQSILKKINPEYSLEGLMLKLKLQSFGHLMQWANSLEKSLILGKIEDRRGGWQRVRQLDGIIFSMDMSVSKLWQIVKDRKAWCAAVHGVAKGWTSLSNWTAKNVHSKFVQNVEKHYDTRQMWVLNTWHISSQNWHRLWEWNKYYMTKI